MQRGRRASRPAEVPGSRRILGAASAAHRAPRPRARAPAWPATGCSRGRGTPSTASPPAEAGPGSARSSGRPAAAGLAGAIAYGSSARSAEAQTSPATREATSGSLPPASSRTRHSPVEAPLRTSAWRRCEADEPSRPGRETGREITRRFPLAFSQLIGELPDLSRAQGFGQEQHAKRARPHRQQAFFHRGRRMIARHDVRGPAAGRRLSRQSPAMMAAAPRASPANGGERLGPRAAGKAQEDFPVRRRCRPGPLRPPQTGSGRRRCALSSRWPARPCCRSWFRPQRDTPRPGPRTAGFGRCRSAAPGAPPMSRRPVAAESP